MNNIYNSLCRFYERVSAETWRSPGEPGGDVNTQLSPENNQNQVDRISELPLDVLIAILFKLRIQDLSRFSQVSHLWRLCSFCCISAKRFQKGELFALNDAKCRIAELFANLPNKMPGDKIENGTLMSKDWGKSLSPSLRPELYHDPELCFEHQKQFYKGLKGMLKTIQRSIQDAIKENSDSFQNVQVLTNDEQKEWDWVSKPLPKWDKRFPFENWMIQHAHPFKEILAHSDWLTNIAWVLNLKEINYLPNINLLPKLNDMRIDNVIVFQLNSPISYSAHFFECCNLESVAIADSTCFDRQELPHYLFISMYRQERSNYILAENYSVQLINCGLKNYHLINLPKILPQILDLSYNPKIKIEPLSRGQIQALQKNWQSAISPNNNNRDDFLHKIEMLLIWLKIGISMKDAETELYFSPSQLVGFKDFGVVRLESILGLDANPHYLDNSFSKLDNPDDKFYAQKYDIEKLAPNSIIQLVEDILDVIDHEFYDWVTGPEALEMLKSRFLASYENADKK